jgi:protein-disulfide isomerase
VFTERNIAEDESALKDLQELNVFSTPAAVINGEVVIGFDRQKLERLLGL